MASGCQTVRHNQEARQNAVHFRLYIYITDVEDFVTTVVYDNITVYLLLAVGAAKMFVKG